MLRVSEIWCYLATSSVFFPQLVILQKFYVKSTLQWPSCSTSTANSLNSFNSMMAAAAIKHMHSEHQNSNDSCHKSSTWMFFGVGWAHHGAVLNITSESISICSSHHMNSTLQWPSCSASTANSLYSSNSIAFLRQKSKLNKHKHDNLLPNQSRFCIIAYCN